MNGFIGLEYQGYLPRMHPRTGKTLRRRLGQRIVFIYGLFDFSGCRYVGQTTNPRKRLILHGSTKGLFRKHGPMLMKVFRYCRERDAARLERQVVFAYRRKGQCDLNRNNNFKAAARASGSRVFWVERKHWFQSVGDAAEYFNCSTATIYNWIEGNTKAYCGITLK